MAQVLATKNTVTLKGSTTTVTEFFQTALSSILYQRGVYPPESFEPRKRYGLTVMGVKDPKLEEYLETVLRQFKGGGVMDVGETCEACVPRSVGVHRDLKPPPFRLAGAGHAPAGGPGHRQHRDSPGPGALGL